MLCSGLLIYFFYQLLVSRYCYQSGIDYLEDKKLSLAQSSFEKAQQHLPGGEVLSVIFLGGDLHRIAKAQGKIFYLKASEAENLKDFETDLGKSSVYYQKGVTSHPNDVEALTGLATTVAAQQQVFKVKFPNKTNPYDALPVFQKSLKLRPYGISLNYQFIRYLAFLNNTKLLEGAITHLATIYPSSYAIIKKEPFYSTVLRDAFKKGALVAIENGQYLREAYSVLSAISLEEDNGEDALLHYQTLLSLWPDKNTTGNYFRAGQLALRQKKFDEASNLFLRTLSLSDDRDTSIRKIFGEYSRQKESQYFIKFTKKAAESLRLSPLLEICKARSFFEAGQLELAKARLLRISESTYSAEALYYLARICESEKDWDNMEIFIQRATVKDPNNTNYHSLFAKALQRQKKYPQAEAAVTIAIESQPKTNMWHYNQRGWIRWQRKNYSGARSDWEQARKLDPKRAAFFHQIALSFRAQKKLGSATKYSKKALQLEPDNEKYKKYLLDLQKMTAEKK